MQKTENPYNRILAYLKGLLSDRQRHDLEKEMMQDAFEDDALEGLSQLSGTELESDMDKLMNRIDDRVRTVKKRSLTIFLRVAAGVVLLLGLGTVLYFVLHSPSDRLLTRKNIAAEQQPAAKPVVSEMAPVNVQDSGRKKKYHTESTLENNPESSSVLAENRTELKEEAIVQPLEPDETRQKAVKYAIPQASADVALPKAAGKSAVTEKTKERIYSGKVVDSEGESLPGVNVMVKGTNLGTVTDSNGKFELGISDTSAMLNLTYVGFKPLDLPANQVPEKTITMQDDLLALNEVVVTAYGIRRNSEMKSSAATTKIDQITDSDEDGQLLLTKPVPPGGSVKAFKKWVTDRLDYTLFKPYPGKQRIGVTLSVHEDGTISDIRVRGTVPPVMADEFKKVMSKSPEWKPAYRQNIPVESQVMLRFIITVE